VDFGEKQASSENDPGLRGLETKLADLKDSAIPPRLLALAAELQDALDQRIEPAPHDVAEGD
jgi:hypothetical protein